VLARPVAQLGAVLEKVQDVSSVNADGDHATLEYAIGREAAAVLLAELMRVGLPVAGFNAHSANLEETYLRSQVRQVE
jgi:hypothetical protein